MKTSEATTAQWLHLLKACGQQSFGWPKPLGRSRFNRGFCWGLRKISLSGPPLFVYAEPTISWVEGFCHVTLRIDFFNATSLSFLASALFWILLSSLSRGIAT